MDKAFPKPRAEDAEDVAWALATAEAMWARGDRDDAVRWIRKAAEAASEIEDDLRALELASAAADLLAQTPPGVASVTGTRSTPPPAKAVPKNLPAPKPSSPARPSTPPAAQARPSSPPPRPSSRRPGPQTGSRTPAITPAVTPARTAATKAGERKSKPPPKATLQPRGKARSVIESFDDEDFDGWGDATVVAESAASPPRAPTKPATKSDGVRAPLNTATELEKEIPSELARRQAKLQASQAFHVVLWKDARGVHVAPSGTVVSAITIDAIVVALDPSADLSAWLAQPATTE